MTSEEFKKWLDDPQYKPLSFNDGSAFRVYMRIPKNEHFDYLYGMSTYHGDSIKRNIQFNYRGIYSKIDGHIYDSDGEFTAFAYKLTTFNNVSIRQSTRTLLTVGTSTSSASLTATNFVCNGNCKTVPQLTSHNVFADVDVTNGSLTVNSGAMNAYVQCANNQTVVLPAYHYNFHKELFGIIKLVDVDTTAKHFVESYLAVKDTASSSDVATFKSLVCDNLDEGEPIDQIVSDIDNATLPSTVFSTETIQGLITLLNDSKTAAIGTQVDDINYYVGVLQGKLS